MSRLLCDGDVDMQSIVLGGSGIVGGHIVRQPTNCTVAFTAAGRGLVYSSPYTQRIWRNGALHAASSEAAKNKVYALPGQTRSPREMTGRVFGRRGICRTR